MARTVIAVFDSIYLAKNAIRGLLDLGLPREQVDLVTERFPELIGNAAKPEKGRTEIVVDELRAGAMVGAGIGLSLGMTGEMLNGLGALHLPSSLARFANAPLIFTVWWLVAILLPAITGLLVSGLIGLGIPEEELRQYAKDVQGRNVTVMIVAEWEAVDRAIEVLDRYNPLEIRQKPIEWEKAGLREKRLAERALHVKVIEQDRLG
jgi:hypothetical protein